MPSPPLKDKLPPYNEEAEKAVLGAVFIAPDAFSEVSKTLQESDFYRPEHQTVFNAMKSLDAESTQVDLLALTNRLKQSGKLEACGGVAYLSNLQDSVPTVANLKYYIDLVRDYSYRRSVLFAAFEMIRQVHDDTLSARDLVEKIEHDIFNLVKIGRAHV